MSDERGLPNINWLLVICLAGLISADAKAQLFYSFVEHESDQVLATLELSALPATHREVVGLTFTPVGETIFGFGPTYTGTFDGSDGEPAITDDGDGGLAAGIGSVIFDLDAPDQTGDWRLDAIMDNLNDDLRDVLDKYVSTPNSAFPPVRVTGNWRRVPEPSSAVLFVGIGLMGAYAVRLRRRRR